MKTQGERQSVTTPLSDRRRRFIHFYLESLNASEAARQAGYKSRSNVAGQRLLTNVDIKAEVSKRINAALGAEKDGLRKKIIVELQADAFNSTETVDDNGNVKIKYSPNRIKAIELLAKYCKLLEDTPTNTNVFINCAKEFMEGHGLKRNNVAT